MPKRQDKRPKPKSGRVGRPTIGPQITLCLSVAMIADIAAALADGEGRAEFIRAAIERELGRREKSGK